MVALLASVDWTQVLVVGVPLYIAAVFSGIAMLLGRDTRKNLKTSNGKTLAEAVEATHKAVTDNSDTLDAMNDATKPPEAPPLPGV